MNRVCKFHGFILFCLFLLSSCNSAKKTDYLDEALQLAGDNRPELERVLWHYSQNEADSLKYRAAVFLIENMPEHYSFQNQAYVERYYDAIDSVRQYADRSEDEIVTRYKAVVDKYNSFPPPIPDLQIIKADYLIDNIDRALDNWQNGRWARHLNFDEFCEYLLPYKAAEYQSLDNWREYLSDTYYGDLKNLPHITNYNHSAYWACLSVHNKVMKQVFGKWVDVRIPDVRRLRSLAYMIRNRNCDDNNIAFVSIMRAKGIPGVIDYAPQQPNTKTGHSWSALLY
jgi:hypothetical protein